jgi:transposase
MRNRLDEDTITSRGVSDSRRAIVIDVEVGRTKESVSKLCTRVLSNKQREKVKTVSTDMWDAYIYGAKTYFPDALHRLG